MQQPCAVSNLHLIGNVQNPLLPIGTTLSHSIHFYSRQWNSVGYTKPLFHDIMLFRMIVVTLQQCMAASKMVPAIDFYQKKTFAITIFDTDIKG